MSLLAGIAAGVCSDLSDATVRMFQVGARYERPDVVATPDDLYERLRTVTAALDLMWGS